MRILVPCAVVLAVLEGCDAHACVGVRVPMWAGGWLAGSVACERATSRASVCVRTGAVGFRAFGCSPARPPAPSLTHCHVGLFGGEAVTCLPWWRRVTGNQGSIPEREPEKRLPLPREAAGAQITHSRHGEVVTKNTDAGLLQEAP
ncbi:CHK1 checkpoint [Echinococcus multilocularis]|uniref:CHK1 checkpoint n=1 Tax=Echinococcus multilocularis TaxID=6211 RepID=A0A0S4MJK0_ECHMU|nr:CHK1 checkpoint [Echinococcus multilocularis]